MQCRDWRSSDGCSKNRSCALRSMPEVGLSARTHKKRGHCSNAGGLSAVLRDQLYSNGRIHVFAAKARAKRILSAPHSFPEPCGHFGLHSPHQSTSPEGHMTDVASIASTSSAHVAPVICPACQSSSIVTKAKSPDADSYWRCTSCGEIWNASRRVAARPSAYRWR